MLVEQIVIQGSYTLSELSLQLIGNAVIETIGVIREISTQASEKAMAVYPVKFMLLRVLSQVAG